MKAKLIYNNDMNCEQLIEVGTHQIQYGGSCGDGFCYKHQSFDCILTGEEKQAVADMDYSAENKGE
jgi:hypothetical protein